MREMRRKRQLLPEKKNFEILQSGTTGVLAVNGDDGYPYSVPLNYVFLNGKVYFHGAKSGHKIDAIQKDSRVSFCVIDLDRNVPAEFTTYFRSVIVFGRAHLVESDEEKRCAVEQLAIKFSPEERKEHRDHEIEREWKSLAVICLEPELITGKQSIELVPKQ